MPLIAIAAIAIVAGILVARANAAKAGSTPLEPTPATSYIQGHGYSLLFLDASGNTDPLQEGAKLLQAGWAPQEGLPVMQRAGVFIGPVGGLAVEWLTFAVRVGPTTTDPNAGLSGFALLENAQHSIISPQTPVAA